MSKRNFILIVIILGVLAIGVVTYWYFSVPSTPEEVSEGGFLQKYNPFKTSPPAAPTPTTPASPTPEPESPTPGEEVAEIKLKKVSSMPVAGYGIFEKERYKDVAAPPENSTPDSKPTPPEVELAGALRYVDRATGNIYQTFADRIEERRFSSTIIPRIHEAMFGQKGDTVIMRYLKSDDRTIETFVGTLPKDILGGDAGLQEIKGVFLPENIRDLSMTSDGSKIFYLINSGENIIGVTMELASGKRVQVFDHAFTEWLPQWPTGRTIALTTKPSANALGHIYVLDPTGKSFVKLFGNINGLTTLTSPDGKLVLWSDSGLNLSIFNRMTGVSDQIQIATLPEKCVWNKTSIVVYCAAPKTIPEGLYPDSWYKGAVSFGDQIWKIDLQTKTYTLLADLLNMAGEDIDGIKLGLDSREEYLFFVDKSEPYLWELELK